MNSSEINDTQLDHVLMCEPDFYGVTYDINPWMTGNEGQVNTSLARRQWNDLRALLMSLGCKVTSLRNPPSNAPDAVFTANAGQVLGRNILLSNFKHHERKVEEPFFDAALSELGYTVVPCCKTYEGQGDTVIDKSRRIAFIGTGHRSAKCSGKCVKEFLGDNIDTMLALDLVDDRFYHLDTCLSIVNGHAFLYPDAFSDVSQKVLHTIYQDKYVPISEKDAEYFACNLKQVGNNIVLNRASAALKKKFASLGLTVHQTSMTEFLKAGGSVRCLTLDLQL